MHKEIRVEYKPKRFAMIDKDIAELVCLLNRLRYVTTYESCQRSERARSMIFMEVTPELKTLEVVRKIFFMVKGVDPVVSIEIKYDICAYSTSKAGKFRRTFRPSVLLEFSCRNIAEVTKCVKRGLTKV